MIFQLKIKKKLIKILLNYLLLIFFAIKLFAIICYKLIAIDLSKQNSDFKNQQINFVGKLEQNAAIFFIIEEKMTTGIKFEQNSLTIV